MTEHAQIAVCAMTKDYEMIRLNGDIIKMKRTKIGLTRFFEYNPVMNDVYPGDSRYVLEPFVLIKELWNTLIWDVRRYIGKAFRLAVQGRRKRLLHYRRLHWLRKGVQRIALKMYLLR